MSYIIVQEIPTMGNPLWAISKCYISAKQVYNNWLSSGHVKKVVVNYYCHEIWL
jgi:hypothetical protein